MEQLARSIRLLVRQPRYTVLAVLTLTVAIGVNSAMFGLLDAVYFRPLPFTDQHELVDIRIVGTGNRFDLLSHEEVRDIAENVPAFQDVLAIGRRGVTLNHQGEAHLLLINYVSPAFFSSLGIPMHLGRGFGDVSQPQTSPEVVVNHHLWKDRLGGAPDVVGRTIQLNSTLFTVIGVTAPGFLGLDRTVRTDVWVTTAQAPLVVPGLRAEIEDRRRRWFNVLGRLRANADVREASAALNLLVGRWRRDEAASAVDYEEARLVAAPLSERNRQAASQGTVFLALVGLVLLIACANVANLTLARGEARRREMSIRAAVGASRLDLVRLMLLESALVSAAGAVAGVLVAGWLIQLAPALVPPGAGSMTLDVRVDSRLLLFALALTASTALLVGLVPAWRSSRPELASGLKAQSSTVTTGGRGMQIRDVLVVGEIALSAVIIIAAGLLVRSYAHGLRVNPGFDTQKSVATFYVVPGLKGYDNEATHRFLEESRRAAAALPGVRRASYGIRLPAQGNEAGWSASFVIPGKEPPPGKHAFDIRYTMVGPDYFEVMGTRVLKGRGITEFDRADAAPVAVIGETMARRFWPGEDAVGRYIRMGAQRPVNREVVGIVEDVKVSGLYETPEAYVFVPFAQHPQSFGLLLVEAQGDPMQIVTSVKRQLADVDPGVPVLRVSSIPEHMKLLLHEDRRNAWIALAVAVLALILGAVGVHGVISLVTTRRTKEIGIRVVLGADRGQLIRLLLGRGLRLSLLGAALGIAGGVLSVRLLTGYLHGVSEYDIWSFVFGTTTCVVVALASTLVPIWRAARLDPAVALRDE